MTVFVVGNKIGEFRVSILTTHRIIFISKYFRDWNISNVYCK